MQEVFAEKEWYTHSKFCMLILDKTQCRRKQSPPITSVWGCMGTKLRCVLLSSFRGRCSGLHSDPQACVASALPLTKTSQPCFHFLFFHWNSVSLCSPGWPGSPQLRLKACTKIPRFQFVFISPPPSFSFSFPPPFVTSFYFIRLTEPSETTPQSFVEAEAILVSTSQGNLLPTLHNKTAQSFQCIPWILGVPQSF